MKTIERLIRKNAIEAGTWEPTHYTSLKQARDLNPGEYPNHFRIATGERTGVVVSSIPTVHKTRFSELGYWHVPSSPGEGPSFWQCVDLTGEKPAQIGTQYATKAELLANLEAYATEYGCDNANPKPTGMPWCERCQCWHHVTAEHIRFGKPGEEYIAPVARQYEGQAHHMSKAAQSLVNILTALDYSKFTTEDAVLYTTNFHAMINSLMAAQDSERLSVTRPDGQVVRVTVPEREE
jgi:hypothetical protein